MDKIVIIPVENSKNYHKAKHLKYSPLKKLHAKKTHTNKAQKNIQHDKCEKYSMQLKQLNAKLHKGYTLKETEQIKIKWQYLSKQKSYYCD